MGIPLSTDDGRPQPTEPTPNAVVIVLFGVISMALYLLLFWKPRSNKSGFTQREQILETVNQLFLFTDEKRWEDLENGVLGQTIYLDMSTLGLKPVNLTAAELCKKWQGSAAKIDSVFHSCSNHHVTIDNSRKNAVVKCCATTTHYKASAVHGMSRDFVGIYELKLREERDGWKVTGFKFDLLFILGNANLE